MTTKVQSNAANKVNMHDVAGAPATVTLQQLNPAIAVPAALKDIKAYKEQLAQMIEQKSQSPKSSHYHSEAVLKMMQGVLHTSTPRAPK